MKVMPDTRFAFKTQLQETTFEDAANKSRHSSTEDKLIPVNLHCTCEVVTKLDKNIQNRNTSIENTQQAWTPV